MKLEISIPEGLSTYVRQLADTGLYGSDCEAVAVLLIRDAIRQCVADRVIPAGQCIVKKFGNTDPVPEEVVENSNMQKPHISEPEPALSTIEEPASNEVEKINKPAVTGAQAAVLAVLEQAEGNRLTHKDIAEKADVGMSTVPYCLNKLEEKGLALRTPYWVAAGVDPDILPDVEKRPYKPRGTAPLRRFTEVKELDPENVNGLDVDHPAVVEGRTLFPTTVVDPEDSPRLLVSGINSAKIGDRVVKGPWSGMPIYTLTLEERASCPRSCINWLICYGNGMPMARRHKHGPELIGGLRKELAELQDKHPDGFVVRLHVLGDFYDVSYVDAWERFLDIYPALHVFGYTAWPRSSDIGKAIKSITDAQWDRFAIRFSGPESTPQGANVINRIAEGPVVPEGIVCPAQTGKTACCGTCGLCWDATARSKTIVFMKHGRIGAKPGPRKAAPTREAKEGKQEKERELRAALGKYFREKDIRVKAIASGRFELRGEEVTLDRLVAVANEMRAEEGLPLFQI